MLVLVYNYLKERLIKMFKYIKIIMKNRNINNWKA